MDRCRVPRKPGFSTGERRGMALFRRKPTENEPERCPLCSERVPDEATECAMCGADLRPLRPRSAEPRVEADSR